MGFEKGSGVNERKGGGDHVLFCLDGVGWSHIVAGDVAALASRQGTSEPPITFSVTRRGRGKTARVRTLIKENEFTSLNLGFDFIWPHGFDWRLYAKRENIVCATVFIFTMYSRVKTIPTRARGDWKS